ncbi:acyltransferase Pun1-like [Lotus japonicus]|uniref:acyltransferase Pun1-like n=1 Tax=Lotus japonicus TaxID=34305 RepID=UPI0025837755|nr:acyltransferase Pun1-like [Lotus japonicus]
MEIKLISRETITPSTPTPPHLRIYPLSFIDHIMFRNYMPSLFFYQPKEVEQECDLKNKICELKKSLSKVLSRYYPLAGRFRDQLSIECNDLGVLFLVTRVTSTKLSSILQDPTDMLLNPLFPDGFRWDFMMSSSGSIVAVQINCFACGGIAISVCMSHKVGDAATIFNFVNDWATMNREKEGELLLPSSFLDGGISMFPQEDLPVFPEMIFGKSKMVVCKRFVFQASKIESLKAMVCSQGVENPTRVQVVNAWIHKCAVSALGIAINATSFRIPVNLRRIVIPPLPNKCVGNMVWPYHVFNPVVDKKERLLPELVSKIKEELCKFCDVYSKKFGRNNKDLSFISECLKQASSAPEPCGSDQKEKEIMFMYSSLCRLPMYETDFGWGKPIWVTIIGTPLVNSVFLIDTSDGKGIEAYVNMDKKDMAIFERNAEILQYASLNPSPWLDSSVTESSFN